MHAGDRTGAEEPSSGWGGADSNREQGAEAALATGKTYLKQEYNTGVPRKPNRIVLYSRNYNKN